MNHRCITRMGLVVRQGKLSIDTEGLPDIHTIGQLLTRVRGEMHLSDDIIKFRRLSLKGSS